MFELIDDIHKNASELEQEGVDKKIISSLVSIKKASNLFKDLGLNKHASALDMIYNKLRNK